MNLHSAREREKPLKAAVTKHVRKAIVGGHGTVQRMLEVVHKHMLLDREEAQVAGLAR